MSDAGANNLEGRADARSVVQFAVNTYGQRVLSNPVLIEGICEDKLPNSPREASLITYAAKADVTAMLSQQVGGVGPDAAVRLTAATLAQSRSLDPAGCVWVVGEFARSLGYEVSEDLEPTAPAPRATPSPVTAPTVSPAPIAVAESQGQDPGVTNPPSSDQTPGSQPISPQRGGGALGRGRGLRITLAVIAIAAVYVGVAAATKLPPFAKSPTAGTVISPERTLSRLIPVAVRANLSCSVTKNGFFGAAASMVCDPSTSSEPYTYVAYYHFRTQAALNEAYATFLREFANTTEGTGNCPFGGGHATTFAPPCESPWVNPNQKVEGRYAEYNFKGIPELTFTDIHNLLLVDLQDANGVAMVNWFESSHNWLIGTH